MGKKYCRAALAVLLLLLLLLPAEVVHASDVEELYDVYDKEFTSSMPEDIVDKIKSYEDAKRYVSMYTYVINSEYDTSVLTEELNSINSRLVELEIDLMSGYDKELSAILSIEEEYKVLTERKLDIESTLQSFPITINSIDVKSVPSYADYKDAVKQKNDFISKREIGNLTEMQVPVQSAAVLADNSADYTSYKVLDNTGILSPLNGTVEKVYVDDVFGLSIVVDNYNGVKTYMCNLEYADVTEGDTVYQNQRVGYCLGSKAVFRLSISDDFVDISKLFKEDI